MDPARPNVVDSRSLVRRGGRCRAAYVQSPEMTGAAGARQGEADAAHRAGGPEDALVSRASELARELAIHLHVGSTAIARPDGKVANRSPPFLFSPDGGTHRDL